MPRFFGVSCASIRTTLLVLAALQLGSCSSPEERSRRYYESGIKLLSRHENAKAAIELRNAVKLKKDLIEAWKALAEIDEEGRNWSGFAADLRALVELNPKDVSARLKLGKLLLLAGSPDEALGLADVGIQLQDQNADLHALKAAVLLKLGNHREANREGQAALALEPTNADALMVLATDRLNSGDVEGARTLLQGPQVSQIIDLQNNVGLQLMRIGLFRKTGDLNNTEAALKRLIELNPTQPSFRKLLTEFYVEEHRPDDAERELRDLVAARPSDVDAALDLTRFLYTVRKSAAAARQELVAHSNDRGDVFPYQMALAELDFAEGRSDDSKQLLEKLINGGNAPEEKRTAKIALAITYLAGKNFDAAEKLINEVLRDDPHSVSALKTRALSKLERGQLEGAIADLSDALNSEPRSTELKLLLAKAYERSGLIELADKELADAVRISNMDAKTGLEYASFLQRRGGIARAEDVLVGLSKRWPNDTSLLESLATIRLTKRDWSGAREAAEAIRKMPTNVGVADQILGAALLGQNRYDEAITVFQRAYKAAPSLQTMTSLVGALLKANRNDQASSLLKTALSENPDNANALALIGSLYLSDGSAEQAHKSFLSAVKAQPKDTVGYIALADFHVAQRDYDNAIEVLQAAIQQRPDATSLHMMLANAFEQNAEFESAISEYQFVLGKEPSNLIATNNLASLLLDHRNDSASLKKARSLAAGLRKSDIPQFKDTLAWALYHQGDYRNAVSLSEEASAALPDQAPVRYHLGMSYAAAGQPTKAKEQLKKALELTSETPLAEQIRAALRKAGS